MAAGMDGANTFGAVLINAKGQVLLRQPEGQFGGYAWTFAKGHPLADEKPADAALRHLRADTGWHGEVLAEIPGTFAGTTSTAKFYLAGRVGIPTAPDAETAAIRWATFEEAEKLVRGTVNATGRERDLAILRAANTVRAQLPFPHRPATIGSDWPILPMPNERTEIGLDLRFTDEAMRRIRKGFRPTDMDEKWFFWFDDDVLHMHRSWTGICIFQVKFRQADGGWVAASAIANRDRTQYEQTDPVADARLIGEMIEYHLVPDGYGYVSPLMEALALAAQPNYLGSPAVVGSIIQRVISIAIAHFEGEASFNEVWATIWTLSNEMAAGNEYTRMPGWHTPQALGASLLKHFHIIDESLIGASLEYQISEAMMAIYLKVRELLVISYYAGEEVEADEVEVSYPQIYALQHWAVAVFLGTSDVLNPGVTIGSFGLESANPV